MSEKEEKTDMYFGKNCPEGMVQVEFVGVSPDLRKGQYGWKPSQNAFLELYVDGRRFRVNMGTFHDGKGERRGLHILAGPDVSFEQTAVNAASMWIKK